MRWRRAKRYTKWINRIKQEVDSNTQYTNDWRADITWLDMKHSNYFEKTNGEKNSWSTPRQETYLHVQAVQRRLRGPHKQRWEKDGSRHKAIILESPVLVMSNSTKLPAKVKAREGRTSATFATPLGEKEKVKEATYNLLSPEGSRSSVFTALQISLCCSLSEKEGDLSGCCIVLAKRSIFLCENFACSSKPLSSSSGLLSWVSN